MVDELINDVEAVEPVLLAVTDELETVAFEV